jgi:hypothetical protein
MEISADADGNFEVRGLPPGEYLVRGLVATSGRVAVPWTGTARVEVDGDRWIRLALSPAIPPR